MKSYIFILAVLLVACDNNRLNDSDEWLVPVEEIFDGGPGKDGIPSVDNPVFEAVSANTYLNPNDLVIGVVHNGEAKAYPHRILDWHEIVNDDLAGRNFALVYCPLTGTGSAWNRDINGKTTTFGVSGKLYNTNIIPYDRETDSYWSQLRLDCVNGDLMGTSIQTFPSIETTWDTWKTLYPNSQVMTLETGFNRNYSSYPYGDYRTNHSNIIFPVNPMDDRLPAKERALVVIADSEQKVYSIYDFATEQVINDRFDNRDILVFGSKTRNFITAYYADGLSNVTISTSGDNAIAMDAAGNRISLDGEFIAGPRIGEQLETVNSILGYYFALGTFYPELVIN